MNNYKVKIIPGATSADPVTATVESRTLVQSMGDAITTLASDDEASVGYGKTIAHVGLHYANSLFTSYRARGTFSWNPWAA